MDTIRFRKFVSLAGILATAVFLAWPSAASACNIPVFRFALERWKPDKYEVIVFHRGPLSDNDKKIVRWLEHYGDKEIPALGSEVVRLLEVASRSAPLWANPFEAVILPRFHQRVKERLADNDTRSANLFVQTLEITPLVESAPLWAHPIQAAILQAMAKQWQSPWLAVRFPSSTPLWIDIWDGPLNPENARTILDSPLRREIARRILSGQSAVWVFLESGDKDKARFANLWAASFVGSLATPLPALGGHLADQPPGEFLYAGLKSQLKGLEKTLELPKLSDSPRDKLQANLKLRIEFSLLRLARTDPAEKVLVHMLLGMEEDLWEHKGPVVFPVFGRGLALYAILGKGINEENIRQSAGFVLGPCSCEVKKQLKMILGGGAVDLLITEDWDGKLEGRWTKDEAPPLMGLTEFLAVTGQPGWMISSPGPGEPGSAASNPQEVLSGNLLRNLGIAAAAALVLLGLIAFLFRDKFRIGT